MIVSELIEKLKTFDGDVPVFLEIKHKPFLEIAKVFQSFDSDKRDNPKVVLTWRRWNYEKEVMNK